MPEWSDRSRRDVPRLEQAEIDAICRVAYENAVKGGPASIQEASNAVRDVAGRGRNHKTLRPILLIANRIAPRAVAHQTLEPSEQDLRELDGRYGVTRERLIRFAAAFRAWVTDRQQDPAVTTPGVTGQSTLWRLLEKIWVPDAERVPYGLLEHKAAGFRTMPISGREFVWQQEDGRITCCWFTAHEHTKVIASLAGLEAQRDMNGLKDRYLSLQKRVGEYVLEAANYSFGVEVERVLPPLQKVKDISWGGTVPESWAPGAQFLIDSQPELQGQAEGFKRDVRLALDL